MQKPEFNNIKSGVLEGESLSYISYIFVIEKNYMKIPYMLVNILEANR